MDPRFVRLVDHAVAATAPYPRLHNVVVQTRTALPIIDIGIALARAVMPRVRRYPPLDLPDEPTHQR